jgi:hypothetical protein
MKIRFVDFEGIHGSGKTACAWNLYNNLMKHGINAEVYFEYDIGDEHENLCNLSFLAILKKAELDVIIQRFAEYKERIMSNIQQYEEYCCIFYAAFRDVSELVNELKAYKADEGRLDSHDFMYLLKNRIQRFVDIALNNEYIYIFESVIFQQILNELVLYSDCVADEMVDFILEIEEILKPLNPMIFYLRPNNLKAQINKVAAERLSDNYDLYPDWIDWMVEYVKKSKYGERNAVENRTDLMTYFIKRAEIEKMTFELLTIDKQEVFVQHMDYEVENQYIYNEVVKQLK